MAPKKGETAVYWQEQHNAQHVISYVLRRSLVGKTETTENTESYVSSTEPGRPYISV